MHLEDGSRRSADEQSRAPGSHPRPWMRWIKGVWREAGSELPADPLAADVLDVHTAVRALPTLLDGSNLPNGVVELVIEDFQAPTRQLFDIHDGAVTLVEPGTVVPWTSISGTPSVWRVALGPRGDVTKLRFTGDEQLAERVLAALPRRQ